MKIKQFEIMGTCLFWKDEKILIIGDMHLGYENYFLEKGWASPKYQMNETENTLKNILAKTKKLKKIILLGDVKHYFGGILKEEWTDLNSILNLLKQNLRKNGKIIITKGNHDSILKPILKNHPEIKLVDNYIFKKILFFHGSKKNYENLNPKLLKKFNLIIQGHLHPAITIKEEPKKEKFKCFLVGKIKELKKQRIILPSFFPLNEGSDISNYLESENLENYKIFAIADKTYNFGKVKNIL